MAERKARSGNSDKSKTSTQKAVDVLKDLIFSNKLPSGSNHLESELAELLGMSRTPVREATLILQSRGLVEVKPRHGIRILPLSPDDMGEIYEILTELESLAAELAANQKHKAQAFNAAERAISQMDRALEKDDRISWAKADDAFHSALVTLGGNSRIATITDLYNDQVMRARLITLNLRPKPTKSNEDHRAVLKAIRDGKGKKAREIHKAHREQAQEILLDILKKYGLHQL
ncbi:MAG: GntR family transcriptional regulator [Pseudomonadota bacterium]